MFVFPLIATLISLIFSGLLLRQYIQKQKPYQLAWAIALLLFGIASLAETIAVVTGWNDILVKIWYLFGGMLVVGFLALGSLYVADQKTASRLLIIGVILTMAGPVLPMVIFSKTALSSEKLQVGLIFGIISILLIALVTWRPDKSGAIWLATMVLASIAGPIMLASAHIDQAKVATEGWEAMERSLLMKSTVASINTLGSIILIGGALYSAWVLLRKQIMYERAIGSILIGVGALVNAAGGFIHGYFKLAGPAVLSISLTVGIVIMFLGFLESGRQSSQPSSEVNGASGTSKTTS